MPADKTQSAEASPPTQRVVSVLELLAAAPRPLTSAHIADSLGLSRSTIGNILSTLQARDWVHRNADLTYDIGPALLRTSDQQRRKLSGPAPLQVALQRLAREVDCGAALVHIDGREIRFTAVVQNRGRIPAGISVGTRLPLIPPAAATIIAHSDARTRQEWLDAAPADAEQFRTALADIHSLGAAVWGVDAHSVAALDVLADVVEHLTHNPADHALRERVVTLLGGISGAAYRPADLDADIALPISYISAPVLDDSGKPLAELLIGPLRSAVTRDERDHYLSAITHAARQLPLP
ncbi:helix-turn-helix domain-containing protein [Nocardia sp. NEAU-G5]|uniref:Helix-turn-helix domain-containing protein n=1 Tax=Nocardia albiluteola TaxID=2842303 RepID=A0ABS6AYT9_9NOCA|nr:helix-turn-helix domain-containing protein [Nocardia albiluteola]MBU3063023.1 helix-turn-helix domain-containing protein [Nocardia albiluteola]